MNERQRPGKTARLAFVFFVLFLLTQLLAAVHVFFSNAALHDTLKAVHQAGYLTVPNMQVARHLDAWSSAFNGGLFFSCTAGIALIILCLVLYRFWILFGRKKAILAGYVLIWAGSILFVNTNGLSSLITIYLISVPVIGFLLLERLQSFQNTRPAKTYIWLHTAFFVLFCAGCASQIQVEKFLDIRDFLFLDNPLGRKLNAFYYDNSLYSANYFKSFSQKLIKTCDLRTIPDQRLNRRVTVLLSWFDYLALPSPTKTDLQVTIQEKTVNLLHNRKVIVTAPIENFLQSPRQYIDLFQAQTDRHSNFRIFTMVSLLFAGTVLLYAILFLLPLFISQKFMPPALAVGSAGLLCFLALFMLLTEDGRQAPQTSPDAIAGALRSQNAIHRIRALRSIVDQKMDITTFAEFKSLSTQGTIPERYWVAKALAVSHSPIGRQTVLQLLHDRHFNVVCMALYSLGKQGRKTDRQIIIDIINTSENWYVQWYAYRALKNLGWHQTVLN